MKMHVIISPDGSLVSDDKVMEFAQSRKCGIVSVATSTMFDAFRLLRARGEIEELVVTFYNGETREVNKFGTILDWPKDPILDTFCDIACEIMTIGAAKSKEDNDARRKANDARREKAKNKS